MIRRRRQAGRHQPRSELPDRQPACGPAAARSWPCWRRPRGIKAFSVGKPSPVMMRAARKELGLTADETTMIGDTMETDILGGVQLGYHTVLMLTGSTKREDLKNYAYQPDLVLDSIADISHDRLVEEFTKRNVMEEELRDDRLLSTI